MSFLEKLQIKKTAEPKKNLLLEDLKKQKKKEI